MASSGILGDAIGLLLAVLGAALGSIWVGLGALGVSLARFELPGGHFWLRSGNSLEVTLQRESQI
jgi:hypothetical protein